MKKDNSLMKTTLIGIICAVIIVAAVVVLLKVTKSEKKTALEPLTKYTVGEDQDEDVSKNETANKYLVFEDAEGEKYTVYGEDYMANLAEDRFIVVNGSSLSFFAEGQEVHLADNVISCTISNDGGVVAFVVPNSGEKAYVGTLYTYNTVTGEAEKINENIFVSTTNRIQLSPSGDAAAYTANYDEEELTYDCCIYKNGKEEIFGQNRDILALSDNADYVYYNIEDPDSYSSIFAVYTEKNGEVILSEAFYNRLYLNLDYSECVYYMGKENKESDEPEALYISRDGSEGELYLENGEDLDISSLVSHVNSVLDVESFE
ncbi:MAG: hypothetical protein LUG66_03880 [Clostridiales bacterium]|nr:hypothetical protein [Clostridiales bacterium]